MSTAKKSILVVDDDDGIRKSLARILSAAGHQVQLAKDGFEAIEICRQFVPDLLLIDIRMPGIDGIETFRRLRHEIPTLVAIFMTAYAGSEKTLEAEELGALSVQAKPLDIDPFLKMIKSALDTSPVLVVDDDPTLLNSIARAIRANGIEVEPVASVEDAMRSLRRRPDRVVVADVFLNDGFGYDLLQQEVQELEAKNQRPFILITGHSEWLHSETARSLQGRAHFMAKPIDIDNLVKQVSGQ